MVEERRKKHARRKDDGESVTMKARMTAMESQLSTGMTLLQAHVTGCNETSRQNVQRLTSLEQTVQPIADFHIARLRKQEAWAKTAETISTFFIGALKDGIKTLLTKYIVPVGLLLLIAFGLKIPEGIFGLLKALGG